MQDRLSPLFAMQRGGAPCVCNFNHLKIELVDAKLDRPERPGGKGYSAAGFTMRITLAREMPKLRDNALIDSPLPALKRLTIAAR